MNEKLPRAWWKYLPELFFKYKNRDGEFEGEVSFPFIFKVTLTKHSWESYPHWWHWVSKWQGGLHITLFMILHFYIGFYNGLGWSIHASFDRHANTGGSLGIRIHLKRVYLTLEIGRPPLIVIDWKMRRLVSKLGFLDP